MSSGTDEAVQWRRLSVLMLLVHPVQEVLRDLPALVPLVIAGASAGSSWPALIGLLVAVALGTARWFTTSFRVTGGQVQLRRGIVNRRTVAVPLDRVRTVDVEANVLHRSLGLVRLRVGTGHTDAKRDKDLLLDGLTLSEGTRLRDELLHDASRWATTAPAADHPPASHWAAVGSAAPPAAGRVGMIVRLDPRWIRYGPFSLTGLITAAAAVGVVWRIVNESQFDPTRSGAFRSGRDVLTGRPGWLVAAAAVLAATVVVAALSTVRYVLAYWQFTLVHTGARTFHTTRGLLTTRATTLEERRVRGVAVTESLLLRWVGGAQVSAVATGLRSGRGADLAGGALLLPPAPRSVALRVSREVLCADAVAAALSRHGPAARRRRLLRATIPGVALLVATLIAVLTSSWAPAWTVAVAALLVAAGAWLAGDRYRNLGHAAADGFLLTGEGSLVRRRVALAQDAIIGWNIRSTLFQRRSGLVTLTATTACGAKRYRILDVAAAEAEHLAGGLTPGMLAPFLA